ncbi:MAG: hypothetical protein AAFW73_14425 [Bacteroidota bacterium]
MELQILVSKKGTRVVTATNLHRALQLPDHKYNSNVERWLVDVYAFKDDVRRPVELKDFSQRDRRHSKLKDFYLSIELAKLITLNSNSGVKLRFAKWLMSLQDQVENAELLTKDQVLTVLELSKAMGLVSCQKSVEQQHLKHYETQRGSSHQWWEYRAQLLGYSVDTLQQKMREVGKNYKGKNLLQMLVSIDRYEVVRMAIIDLFIALGKSYAYAKNMGDLAKIFAREMKVEIWDDRGSDINFGSGDIDQNLVQKLRNFQHGQTSTFLEAA